MVPTPSERRKLSDRTGVDALRNGRTPFAEMTCSAFTAESS